MAKPYITDRLVAFDCRALDGRCNCKWPEGVSVPPMCKYLTKEYISSKLKGTEDADPTQS